MSTADTSRSLVTGATGVAHQASRRAIDWNDWRRKAVAGVLQRVFRRVGGSLSEPGGLPTTGIHRVLVCRPNHRLGNTVLISPLIAEIEALYPGAQIDILGSSASESLYADRFRIHRVFVLPQKIARHLWTSFKALQALRRCRYDLAIDACQGSQSGRLVLALFPGPLQTRLSRPPPAPGLGLARTGMACASGA